MTYLPVRPTLGKREMRSSVNANKNARLISILVFAAFSAAAQLQGPVRRPSDIVPVAPSTNDRPRDIDRRTLPGRQLPQVLFLQPYDAARAQRLIAGKHQVNVAPLLYWLRLPANERDKTDRPLLAWKQIIGKILADYRFADYRPGWVVQVTIDGSTKTEKVLLGNPPIRELANFRQLEARWHALAEEEARLTPLAKAEQGVVIKENLRAPPGSDERLTIVGPPAKARLESIRAEMRRLPLNDVGLQSTKDFERGFIISDVALETQETLNGIRVYDCGHVTR